MPAAIPTLASGAGRPRVIAPASGCRACSSKDFATDSTVSPGLKVGPYSSFANMGYYQNRRESLDQRDLCAGQAHDRCRRRLQLYAAEHHNNRTGIAQVTVQELSRPFWKMQAQSSSVLESIDPATGKNLADRYYRSNEIARLCAGQMAGASESEHYCAASLRLSRRPDGEVWQHLQLRSDAYNVTGDTTSGFTVNNAGFVVAGNNKYYPTPGVSDSTLTGRQWGISPRVGFAWSAGVEPWHGGLPRRLRVCISIAANCSATFHSRRAAATADPSASRSPLRCRRYIAGNGKTLANPLGTIRARLHISPPSANPATITAAVAERS